MLIAEDSADADAELNADGDADADVNADGLAKQWARWAPPLPCCYGQGSQVSTCSSGLQTGRSTIRDAIRISNGLPALPACHCLSGYTERRRENNPKKLVQSVNSSAMSRYQ